MAKHIGNIVFGVFTLITSICFWFVADTFPTFEKYKNIDSDFWPKILMVMIGIFSVGVLYQSIIDLNSHLRKRAKVSTAAAAKGSSSQVDWKRFGVMGGLCIAYFWGLQKMGFLLATLFFLWISISFIGLKGRFLRHLYPLLFTACLAFLFVKVLELSLPRGQWIFREFSLLFY